MLPFVTHFAVEKINGSRWQCDGGSLETALFAASESHCRFAAERNTDNGIQFGTVHVPADARSDFIMNDRYLDDIGARNSGELCRDRLQRLKKLRNRFRRPE